MEFKGVYPLISPDSQGSEAALEFRLPHRDELSEYVNNKEQKAIWAALFGFRDKWETAQSIDVSVGIEDGFPLQSNAKLNWNGRR